MPPCSFLALCNPLDHIRGRPSITDPGTALELCINCQASREREKEWEWERKTETDRKPEKERQKEMPKQGTVTCFVRCSYVFLCILIWVYPHKSRCLRGNQTCEMFLELTYSMWVWRTKLKISAKVAHALTHWVTFLISVLRFQHTAFHLILSWSCFISNKLSLHSQ